MCRWVFADLALVVDFKVTKFIIFKLILKKISLFCELAELQSQCPAGPQLQEGEGNLGMTRAWAGDESWRVQMVAGASDSQLECVVS